MLNLYQPERILDESYAYFKDVTAMWPGSPEHNVAQRLTNKKKEAYPPGSRLVITEYAENKEEAIRLADRLKAEYDAECAQSAHFFAMGFSLFSHCAMIKNRRDLRMCRITPEKAGICSANVQKFIEFLEKNQLSTHDVILSRGNDIFFETYWEPFGPDFLHRMYSVSKSFVSLAIGFLEQEGKLGRFCGFVYTDGSLEGGTFCDEQGQLERQADLKPRISGACHHKADRQ